MLDNSLIRLIWNVMTTGQAALGLSYIDQVADYQPTQQGVPSGPTIFLYKVGPDIPMGTNYSDPSSGGAAIFTGSITGNVLTVSSVDSGSIFINQLLTGEGLPSALLIQSLGTGTGGVGTYILNFPLRALVTDLDMETAGALCHQEITQYQSIFQMSALATQDPKDTNLLTASDICNFARQIMNSSPTIATLEANGVGILKISQVRNPQFTDDRERYEASPSFDFTLTHKQVILTTIPAITGVDFQVDSV